jgi:SAM-dependent methyltransferase
MPCTESYSNIPQILGGDLNMNTPTLTNQPPYLMQEWDNYARLFASVTTSMQLEVYREACLHLSGDVIDCGCGSAKIAPLLLDEERVVSYTGVDYAEEMVSMARWILNNLQCSAFTIRHGKIEDVDNRQFTSGVSIQSYYSWSDPVAVLTHVFTILAPGAVFVLATPNRKLELAELARDAWKELLAHPDFEAYKAYNLKLATNPQAHFISMGDLVSQVQQLGFRVEECHQRHFRGGLNFLVLRKNG